MPNPIDPAMPGRRLSPSFWLAGRVAAAIGLYACIAAALLKWSYLSDLLAILGASLLLLGAALFDHCYATGTPPVTDPATTGAHPLRRWLTAHTALGHPGRITVWLNRHRAYISAAFLGFSAVAGAFQAIAGSGGAAPAAGITIALAAASLLLALLLIVAERWVAALANGQLNGQLALARMLRVPIAACLFVAATIFAQRNGLMLPHAWVQFGAAAIGIVALEVGVRAMLGYFDPSRHGEPSVQKVQPLVDSVLVSWFRRGASPWLAMCDYYAARFGVDLRQSRGLIFIRRAIPGFLLLSCLLAYTLSAVTELQPNQRGIDERFGQPVRVLQPGLHVGLPWPFGKIIPVENGVLHEFAIASADLSSNVSANTRQSAIDGPPPDSANRLWDSSHAFDTTQLIAGQSNGRESFQVMNVDARFIYRIGASERDALAANYQIADLPGLLRTLAGRILIKHFSTQTLQAILGEPQDRMAHNIKLALQADCDRLHSGVEIVAVIIESIHPPGGAANAYHNVQAAELDAQALIFSEQAQAAQIYNEAEQNAAVTRNGAQSSAAQIGADANASALRFDASQAAYRDAGPIFLREQYMHALAQGLPHAKLVILDHRIADASRSTIDLRDYTQARPDVSAALLRPNVSGAANTK
jgi:regulator of protease activity HflC (stomatin/prohibitin superfamily)